MSIMNSAKSLTNIYKIKLNTCVTIYNSIRPIKLYIVNFVIVLELTIYDHENVIIKNVRYLWNRYFLINRNVFEYHKYLAISNEQSKNLNKIFWKTHYYHNKNDTSSRKRGKKHNLYHILPFMIVQWTIRYCIAFRTRANNLNSQNCFLKKNK